MDLDKLEDLNKAKMLDTPENRETAYNAALAYLTNPRYRFTERSPWNTFVDKLELDVDKAATIDNMYFVEGLDGTHDYFGVLMTLKSGAKPAALQVSLPSFDVLRGDAVPLLAGGDEKVSVMDITRLPSLPPGPLRIKFRSKEPREENPGCLYGMFRIRNLRQKNPRPNYGPLPASDHDFIYDQQRGDMPEPTLVWKPSRQSFSPFVPFYKFDLNGRVPGLPDKHFYLRADFQVQSDVQTVNMTGFTDFDTTVLGF
jgi:hypothetical protein